MRKLILFIALVVVTASIKSQTTYVIIGDSATTNYGGYAQGMSAFDQVNNEYYAIKGTAVSDTIVHYNICGQILAKYPIVQNGMYNPIFANGVLYGLSPSGFVSFDVATQTYSTIGTAVNSSGSGQGSEFKLEAPVRYGHLRYNGSGFDVEILDIATGTVLNSQTVGFNLYEPQWSSIDNLVYGLSATGVVTLNVTTGNTTSIGGTAAFIGYGGSTMGNATFNQTDNRYIWRKGGSGTPNKDTLMVIDITTGGLTRHTIPQNANTSIEYSEFHKTVNGLGSSGFDRVELEYVPYRIVAPSPTTAGMYGGVSTSDYHNNLYYTTRLGTFPNDTIYTIDICGNIIQKTLVPSNSFTGLEFSELDSAIYSASTNGFTKLDLATGTVTTISAVSYQMAQGSQTFDQTNNVYVFKRDFWNGSFTENHVVSIDVTTGLVTSDFILPVSKLTNPCWTDNGFLYGHDLSQNMDYFNLSTNAYAVKTPLLHNSIFMGMSTYDHLRDKYIYTTPGSLGVDTIAFITASTGALFKSIAVPQNHMYNPEALAIGFCVGVGPLGWGQADGRDYPTPNGDNIYMNLSATLVPPRDVFDTGITFDVPDTVITLGNDFYWLMGSGYSLLTVNGGNTGESSQETSEMLSVQDLEQNIMIYPNPTSSTITITGVNVKTVEIINSLGELVIKNQTEIIDLTKLPKGLYFIKINDTIVKQIVKK